MKVIKATYGGVDCTDVISKRVVGNQLIVRSNNDIIGDTVVGQVKFLEVELLTDKGPLFKRVSEGGILVYPESKVRKLGIFYSNNNNKKIWPSIYRSLNTIKQASEGVADIVTCMWDPMPENPFYQVRSWYQSQSHLNQLLQIMQCLYAAQETGEYDYVSFLEHDVMYPEGYFDFPEFERGSVLTNMNYGGLCINGWQERGQDDEPFHQMTMRFEDAIDHCLSILPNALKTNSGMIENQTIRRIQWRSQNQAIHINHGVHFTSHNSIYRKDNLSLTHNYWGNHSDYTNLFV